MKALLVILAVVAALGAGVFGQRALDRANAQQAAELAASTPMSVLVVQVCGAPLAAVVATQDGKLHDVSQATKAQLLAVAKPLPDANAQILNIETDCAPKQRT